MSWLSIDQVERSTRIIVLLINPLIIPEFCSRGIKAYNISI